MENTNTDTPTKPIELDKCNLDLAAEIQRRSGVNINMCWHCMTCTNGCPFSQAMDYPPNSVIRFAQLGLKREALENSGIWICVGCNTCSIQCPNAIDISAVNDTLRQMAIEEGAAIAAPDILNFHREVIHSIERYGRANKLEIMMRYKLKSRDWFTDAILGIKMLIKHKLELLPSKIRSIGDMKRIFKPKPMGKSHAGPKAKEC